MKLTSFNNRVTRTSSDVVLANGLRPQSKDQRNQHGRTTSSIVVLVPKWSKEMPKHYTSGSRLPKYEHTKVLDSKRGLWLMEFVNKDGLVYISMFYVDSQTQKETAFDGITAKSSENIWTISLPPMEAKFEKMFDDLMGLNGTLLPAILAGINRVTNPEWDSLYDWH